VTSKKYILEITPQTHIRSTQGDRIYFRIPREKLRPPGLRRLLRLERYNKYKIDVSALAKAQKLDFPHIGASIKFYLPVPKTWKKWKKEQHHLQYHTSRCDLDNMVKALFDSLMSEDKHIAHFEAAKYWTNSESGWIEITDNFKVGTLI
jgi:Holliday junction resolvase RusA-like endonuclease